VDAETDQRDHPDADQEENRRTGELQALARAPGGEDDERQREPGGHLDAHSHRHRRAGRA